MYVLFLGPPGCGKGTQAQYLAEIKGFYHLSTGNLLRAEIEAQTELGKQMKDLYATGKLVDGELVLKMVQKVVASEGAKSILFDGFPRTVSQAIAFGGFLQSINKKFDCVFSFSLADDEILDRISGRMTCADCKTVYHIKTNPTKKEGVCNKCDGKLVKRTDDSRESVKLRLDEYHRETEPLKEFYKKENVVYEIDANQPIEVVRKQVLDKIEAISERKEQGEE
jgi:adenylate kinase